MMARGQLFAGVGWGGGGGLLRVYTPVNVVVCFQSY